MANRLAEETSPYLRQHADNPVDWYPWGEEALTEARRRDRPLLISVGYSSCHWCHVMAHESFEDPAAAARMNELFVNIKVDREERPDVDAIYMEAVQALSGHGGWPMTVFCTPDGRPFFGGTYFPKVGRGGMISFTELLDRIDDVWRTRRADLERQADELVDIVGRLGRLEPTGQLVGQAEVRETVGTIVGQFDPDWGGFGSAPKFPQAMTLDLLVQLDAAPQVVATSLDAMASGGIYDHLGGGFARYATDRRWLVPHFEKMLYDQALCVRAYLHAWQRTGAAHLLQVVAETIEYVERDLALAAGAIASAEDADSEGVEGKFYTWSFAELHDVGGDLAVEWYGASEAGNWEGTNILWRPERGDLLRPAEVEAARQALFERRCRRVRPGLDDKVLTEWNALWLSALAEAALVTGRSDWLDAATRVGAFLWEELRRPDGRWLRSWQSDGGARHLGYAADHAAIVDALVRLGEAAGEPSWLARAEQSAADLIRLFWDDAHGGVYTTGTDAEALITRPKDLLDTATPSANSLTARALLRLGALTGDDDLVRRAEAIIRLAGEPARAHPNAFAHLLGTADLADRGLTEVVVAATAPEFLEIVRRRWRPDLVLAWGEPGASPLWEGRVGTDAAYVCRHGACGLPARTPAMLDDQLAPSS